MRKIQDWQARSVINRSHDGNHYGFEASLNPYRGCAHGCHYCYARETHRYLGLDLGEDFVQRLFVKKNLGTRLVDELRRLPLQQVLAVGTATDPYQSLEGRYRLTRQVLEAVLESGHALTITTKSPLIVRDLDLLRQLAANGQVVVHISLISLDRDLLRTLEPGAPSPKVRLDTIERLAVHMPVVLFAAPVVPYLTDQVPQLDTLYAAARAAGATAVMASRMRLSPVLKPYFLDWLRLYHPPLLPAYQRLYPGLDQFPNDPYSQALKRLLAELAERHGLAVDLPRPSARRQLAQPQFDFMHHDPTPDYHHA